MHGISTDIALTKEKKQLTNTWMVKKPLYQKIMKQMKCFIAT